jgi:hypothetical protein
MRFLPYSRIGKNPRQAGAGCDTIREPQAVAGVGCNADHLTVLYGKKAVNVLGFSCGQMRALTSVASAKAGVQVQEPQQRCLDCRSKSKTCDEQVPHIVCVSLR